MCTVRVHCYSDWKAMPPGKELLSVSCGDMLTERVGFLPTCVKHLALEGKCV